MEIKKRLIDFEQAKRATYEEVFWSESEQAVVRNFLAKLPKVDAVEVVHGRWEEDDPPKHYIFTGVDVLYRCSECNNRFVHDTKYFPNCGAKMDGGNDDVV